jgi:HlyD family secretion protein
MLAQTGSSKAPATPGDNGIARTRRSAGARTAASKGLLWSQNAKGKLVTMRVQVGISDGQKTEVRGTGITPGMQVLIGTSSSATTASSGASSPFQQQSTSGSQRGPRGGGF